MERGMHMDGACARLLAVGGEFGTYMGVGP